MGDDSRTRRFERLVMPHLDAAYTLARWLIRNRDDAEDVMQEAMLRAYKFLDSCREDTSRQWVVRIVRNACYDWLNLASASRVSAFADLNPDDDDGAGFSADAFRGAVETPEDSLARKETRYLVDELVGGLPAEFREIIVLREFEDFSYREIAEIAGVPLGTVMSRLSRARALLQKEWKERHERS